MGVLKSLLIENIHSDTKRYQFSDPSPYFLEKFLLHLPHRIEIELSR